MVSARAVVYAYARVAFVWLNKANLSEYIRGYVVWSFSGRAALVLMLEEM
jgi:hypothetical protein